MSDDIRVNGFNILPIAVKNLLIINGLFFLAKIALASRIDLDAWLGLHYIGAPDFHIWQFVTYMFMHGNFSHLFFNMFALWMFGSAVENAWGTRRFLFYYFFTGIGAALVHYLVIFIEIHPVLTLLNQFLDNPSFESYQYLVEHNTSERFHDMLQHNLLVLQNNHSTSTLNEVVLITSQAKSLFLNSFNIVGASGAVFGLLLAFGMLFPNAQIYIYFLIPMKAKWFVILYGALELFFGVTGTQDGIGHFAHLGGMLFGIILILIWRQQNKNRLFIRPRRKKKKFYTSYNEPSQGRVVSDEEYNYNKKQMEDKLDAILDKISKSGYDSLSKEEKDFLFFSSKRKNNE